MEPRADQRRLREEFRLLNLEINNQLLRAGIIDHKGKNTANLSTHPNSEWRTWIQALMARRDMLENQID